MIFASRDISVTEGIVFHPVAGGDKPQMFRKRTVSKVTSKVFESGGLPEGGKSKSHWKSLITRGFNF